MARTKKPVDLPLDYRWVADLLEGEAGQREQVRHDAGVTPAATSQTVALRTMAKLARQYAREQERAMLRFAPGRFTG